MRDRTLAHCLPILLHFHATQCPNFGRIGCLETGFQRSFWVVSAGGKAFCLEEAGEVKRAH